MNEFGSCFKKEVSGGEVELNSEKLLNYNEVANEIATLIRDLKKSTSLDLGLDYLMDNNGEFTICIIAYDYHLAFEKGIKERIDFLESRVIILEEERDKLTRIQPNYSIFRSPGKIKNRILEIQKEEKKLNGEIQKEEEKIDEYLRNKASINAVTDEIKKLCKSNNIQATTPLNTSSGKNLLYILLNQLLQGY